jgi:hypothetical protein
VGRDRSKSSKEEDKEEEQVVEVVVLTSLRLEIRRWEEGRPFALHLSLLEIVGTTTPTTIYRV